MINFLHIRKAVIFKLFDALIVPVVSYGCQIWLPQTYFMGAFLSGNYSNLKLIGQDPFERIHLSFLKWTLNVNKTTSNAAIWGDTGRYPLAIELSSQVYNYWERLEKWRKLDLIVLCDMHSKSSAILVSLGTPTSRLHGRYYANSMEINFNTHLFKSEMRCDSTSGRHGAPSDCTTGNLCSTTP